MRWQVWLTCRGLLISQNNNNSTSEITLIKKMYMYRDSNASYTVYQKILNGYIIIYVRKQYIVYYEKHGKHIQTEKVHSYTYIFS